MDKLTNCKACGKEIAKGVKKCPHCGKDQRNWFMKHWVITFILAVVVIGMISSLGGGGSNDNNTKTKSSPNVTQNTPTKTPKEKTWSTGTYLVGTDIQAGLYKVKLTDTITKMGYVERSKDVTMAAGDIIANILINGDGYVEIKNTDKAVRLIGVDLTKVDYGTLPVNIKTELSDGIYLVNKDLKPGTYKVVITDTITKIGYVERSKNVSMGADDIIANELFQGDGYVKILGTDYAVRLQGVKLIFQN